MKIRTGHGPNDWRDDGPQSVTAHVNNFAVGAVTGDRMVPTLTGKNYSESAAETAKRKRYRDRRKEAERIARELNPPPKVVCGALLRIIGEPCARRPGHADNHLSRLAMDVDRDSRRARKRSA